MGCKDAVLLESLAKNHTANCSTHEENTRKPNNDNLVHLRALALHWHGKRGLEEEDSKLFLVVLEKYGGSYAACFQDHWMNDFPIV